MVIQHILRGDLRRNMRSTEYDVLDVESHAARMASVSCRAILGLLLLSGRYVSFREIESDSLGI